MSGDEKLTSQSTEILKHHDNLLTFMTHLNLELRTPLNTIIGYTEMLQEDMQSNPIDQSFSYLSKIIDSAKYLIEIINNISDLSKIDTGETELFLENTFLDNILTELESSISSQLIKDGKTFNLVFDPTLEKQVTMHTDPGRVKFCLYNFIANISKITHQNKIELHIQRLIENDSCIKFTFKNTSNQFTKNQLEKFFNTFTHDADTARQYGAIGLSLYLARRFAEILGGGITIEICNDNTAIFSMIIPTHTTSTYIEGIKAKFSEVSTVRDKTVLIIDSSLLTHRELQSILGKEQFFILHAFDCEEGIKLAKLNKPGIIVLDIPEVITLDMNAPIALDGWAVLSALKSEPAITKIPVIVMSHFSENNLGFTLGAVDYINKPVDPQLLAEKIKQFTPVTA